VNLLLDTHALIWWLAGHDQLSPRAAQAIAAEDNEVFVSAASAMEVATKHRIGKLPGAAYLALNFEAVVQSQGFRDLPITASHARLAGAMNIAHKDPFDRFLIAQALAEDLYLVSNESLFDAFSVQRLW
jgi:PIN domain nuclease of toxin-antitoxin system